MVLRRIALLSPAPDRAAAFYADKLGLPARMEGDAAIVAAGETTLEFRPAGGRATGPYHFAFNVAPNRLVQARRWLRERVAPLSGDDGDLFEFADWNAHALYFKDADGNLAEFIARHDLPPVAGDFGPQHILNVSEIGVVVPDVAAAADFLRREFDLPTYRSIGTDFAAVGDVHGLFILVKRGRVWFPTKDMAPGASPADVVVGGSPHATARIPGSECDVAAG